MLSSVLHSKRAIQVNIEIMRAFVRLRRMLASNVGLARKLATLEKKYGAQFRVAFDAIRALQGHSNAAEGKDAVSGRADEATRAKEKALHRFRALGGEAARLRSVVLHHEKPIYSPPKADNMAPHPVALSTMIFGSGGSTP